MQKLEIQQLQQEYRKQIAAAALEKIKLITKPTSDRSSTGKTIDLFAERSSFKSKELVQDWFYSSLAGNVTDFANEPGLHFSDSIV